MKISQPFNFGPYSTLQTLAFLEFPQSLNEQMVNLSDHPLHLLITLCLMIAHYTFKILLRLCQAPALAQDSNGKLALQPTNRPPTQNLIPRDKTLSRYRTLLSRLPESQE